MLKGGLLMIVKGSKMKVSNNIGEDKHNFDGKNNENYVKTTLRFRPRRVASDDKKVEQLLGVDLQLSGGWFQASC